jgi:uncharacterized protein YeaO (DUF488 family)
MSSGYQHAIQLCRVYTPPAKKTGTWILVDKLWPRGLKKEKLDFDLWLKEIAPSTELRQWYHSNPADRWSEFVERYVAELKDKKTLIEDIQKIASKSKVTLFYAAKDTEQNHAIILREVICSWPKRPKIKPLL